jgi:small subunit ribosomal protein S6
VNLSNLNEKLSIYSHQLWMINGIELEILSLSAATPKRWNCLDDPLLEKAIIVHKEKFGMSAFVYETMYILRPDMSEEDIDGAIAKYQNILKENGGEILETQHRGKRRMAYIIQKHRDGVYVQMNYQAPGSAIAILERAMRLSEDVIRYLTVKQEAAESDAETVAVEA